MGYHLATLQAPLVIRDANVITDMADACLFQAWATSENKAFITDLVEQEFRKEAQWRTIHPLIAEGFIEVADCAEKEMATLVKIRNTHGINIADASIIFLGKEYSGIILTEDPKLRTSCLRESIICSEILWIFDHLLFTGNLQFSVALEGLDKLTSRRSRLQVQEVQKRMEAWTRNLALPPMPTFTCPTSTQSISIEKKTQKTASAKLS